MTISNPYNIKNSYKGQLHFHSTESDGADTPTAIVTAYKNAGYDFVCLTDHNKVTADPSVAGILFIKGCEETATEGHINSIGATNTTAATAAQTIVNYIIADGGIPILNHPNWSGAVWTNTELSNLTDYCIIEVFNNGTETEEGNGNAEDKWDYILSNLHSCWGVAGDDCHNIAGDDFNKAWIYVFAESCTEANIKNAISLGNFYASTGAVITGLSLENEVITITTDINSTIEFITNKGDITSIAINVKSASFKISNSQKYVRIKIINADGIAWTNPIFFSEIGTGSIGSKWLNHDYRTEGDPKSLTIPKRKETRYSKWTP